MNETILYKYLSGTATEKEKEEILDWIKDSQENQIAFFEMKAVWNSKHIYNNEKHDVIHSLDQLNRRIDQIAGWKRMYTRRFIKKLGIVATAAIVLLAISFSFLFTHKKANIQAPIYVYKNGANDNSIKTIFLADGATVWLGSNTTLTCPTTFDGDTREIQLEGEAFFEVSKDPEHPFIVKTENNLIKVLGTSFSVHSRPVDNICETILMSGSVLLSEKNGKEIATLQPGQQALYSKETKSVEINEVDANTLTSWRFGLISLSEVSISEILQCLENTYNIHIKMDTHLLKDRKYNFSFKYSKEPKEALNQLSYITGISAEIIP